MFGIKTALTSVLVLLILSGCRSVPRLNEKLAAKRIAEAPDGNIASGKKYKIFQAPVTTWHRYITSGGKKIPDYSNILTDGKIETDKMFWTSDKCANFMKTTCVDVLIDLEEIYPIEEIKTRHGARPTVGIFMPVKEEYFVSDDGKDFAKVAEYINKNDPEFINDPYDKKGEIKKFSEGIKEFSSGKLKTYGRYVLVRTYGFPDSASGHHLHFPGYVGYDEIVVKGGKFKMTDIEVNDEEIVSFEEISDAPFVYHINKTDWLKKLKQNPFIIGLMPQTFLGDKEYHMTVDGVYAFGFDFCNMAAGKVTDIEFQCLIPEPVEILDWNNTITLVEKKNVDIEGKKYTKITQKLKDNITSTFNAPFYIVAPKSSEPIKDYGILQFSYTYKVNGKAYSPKPEKVKLVLGERIKVAVPKNFRTGFWLPYYMRCFKYPEKTCRRLFAFYKSAGFNWANGGQKNKEIYSALKELNMESTLEGGLAPNALQVVKFDKTLRKEISKDDFFVFYPEKKNPPYGVCPTKVIAGKFDRQLIKRAKDILLLTDDVYENWEPYMFEKRGCACNACKKAFQEFAKISDGELNKIWPKCVSDWSNQKTNAFSTWQYGQVVKKYQNIIRKAAKELGLKRKPDFVPSLEPRYMNPQSQHYKVQSVKDYIMYLNKLIFWFYHNTINYLGVDERLLVGNNLPIIEHFDNAKMLRDKYGRKLKKGLLPKLYYLPAEYWTENYVMGKDFYFISVLTFLEKLDGYGAWHRAFKQDARYIKQNAKANRFIAFYEDIILTSTYHDSVKTFSLSALPEIFGRKPVVLYSKSYRYNGHDYVAFGNDYYYPLFFKASFKNLKKGQYSLVDALNKTVFLKSNGKGFTAEELLEGVLLNLEGKEWRIFEVVPYELEALKNLKIVSETEIIDHFDAGKTVRQKQAENLSINFK